MSDGFDWIADHLDMEAHIHKKDFDYELYKKYIRSKAWKTKRKEVFDRDNNCCVKCGSTNKLHCHHLTYERLGSENTSDLQTLCKRCHATFHWTEMNEKHTKRIVEWQEMKNTTMKNAVWEITQ